MQSAFCARLTKDDLEGDTGADDDEMDTLSRGGEDGIAERVDILGSRDGLDCAPDLSCK